MSDLAVIEQDREQLNGLLFSLSDRTLLVPNTAVAELIGWQPLVVPGTAAQAANGLAGLISWRGTEIPLVVLEVMDGGEEPEHGSSTRMAIMNSLGAMQGRGFYALLVQGIPRSVILDAYLQRDSAATLLPTEADAVHLDSRSVRIPDLEAIEENLFSILQAQPL